MKRKLLILLALALCLTTAVWAAEQAHVIDLTLNLTNDQWQELNTRAEEASLGGCGVYIIMLDDYRDYASSPQSCAEKLYVSNNYGVGAEADGILLLLSMDDRDYAIVGHGPLGRSTVNRVDDYAFLDDFGSDDWYGGFSDYIAECTAAMALGVDAEAAIGGQSGPQAVVVSGPPGLDGQTFLYIVLGSAVVSLIVCLVLLSRMKTARKQTAADAYVPDRGVELRVRTDLYTHTTRSVRHVPKNNSSSGGSRGGGGGGFSGRSGKF